MVNLDDNVSINIDCEATLDVYQNEEIIYSRTFYDVMFECDCFNELDFSAYVINPTGITLESTTLEF